ncbi:hypothetical protein BIFPSEUDO_02711 [Bifidobacterium pseudocatenulatum DSM 20438 = JCM 1200 = LMG 10505]|uniref:Uncharacterized protein n=1 Tax=Bifidobacterium pseudocatenulatum DSM 20438 = JCM 1200 = LMG 10505 TaxID=547043 RepID=C0BQQ9_BIFPS|nr:hypothetical protein BIFPSEUDO_02711 [Bifidobacterium pseudocatenulatum DSM 20438 = JCM 1200 = LMG 10505]
MRAPRFASAQVKIRHQTEIVQTESRVIQEYENPVSAAKY